MLNTKQLNNPDTEETKTANLICHAVSQSYRRFNWKILPRKYNFYFGYTNYLKMSTLIDKNSYIITEFRTGSEQKMILK